MAVDRSAFEQLITNIKAAIEEGTGHNVVMYGHVIMTNVNSRRINLGNIDSSKPFMLYILNLSQYVPVIPLQLTMESTTINLEGSSKSYTPIRLNGNTNKWNPTESQLFLTMKLELLGYGVYEFGPTGGTLGNSYYYEVTSDIDTDTWETGMDYSIFHTEDAEFDYIILQ